MNGLEMKNKEGWMRDVCKGISFFSKADLPGKVWKLFKLKDYEIIKIVYFMQWDVKIKVQIAINKTEKNFCYVIIY